MMLVQRLAPIFLVSGILLTTTAVQAAYHGASGGNRPETDGNPEGAASVTIHAPKDGSELQADQPVQISYQVTPGPKGDHVHLYVNGKEVAILRRLEGTHETSPLSAGRHELAIKVVNRAHVPIGVEALVTVDLF
jgi:hypothetical protein